MIFIVIPQNTHSIFLEPVLVIINATGNLICVSDSTTGSANGYDLCVIRVYTYTADNDTLQSVSVRDGMWFTNTYRQLIQMRNCTGFDSTRDIGSGECDLMPYETADTMTLCICAESGCNDNLQTCLKSNAINPKVPALPSIMSNLTVIIECAAASASDFTCSLYANSTVFINETECADYVKTHSVLCIIDQQSVETSSQEALIEEDYQSYLTSRLFVLKELLQGFPTALETINQSDTNIYVQTTVDSITDEECGCTQTSFCNNDIRTCVSDVIQITTATSTEFSATFFTNLTSESTIVTTSITIESTTGTASTATESTTGTTSITTEPTTGTISMTTESTTGTISMTIESTTGTTSMTTEPTTGTISMTTESTTGTISMTTESTTGTISMTTESITGTTSMTTESTTGIISMTTESTTGITSTTTESATNVITTISSSTPILITTASSELITTATSFPTTANITAGSTTVNATATIKSTTTTSVVNVANSTVASKL